MPLDFVRQPLPRNLADYIAVRRFGTQTVNYEIWKSSDSGFGLTLSGLPPATHREWHRRYRGHCGLVWLRTKLNCEKVANEIAEMVEREYATLTRHGGTV